MEASVQPSREILPEGWWYIIILDVIICVCTVVLTIIAIISFVRSDNEKK